MRTLRHIFFLAVIGGLFPNEAHAKPSHQSFLLHEAFGGRIHDAEKSRSSGDDDLLCWAAAAANVLAWTHWGKKAGFSDEDAVFKYLQDHWTDHGSGSPRRVWNWWFTGVDPWPKGAKVRVPGGGFHKKTPFPKEPWQNKRKSVFRGLGSKMIERKPLLLRNVLKEGCGMVTQIVRPKDEGGRDSHMVTLWGYRSTAQDEFTGIYITDSDDNKQVHQAKAAQDALVYYPVSFSDGKWWLKDYGGSGQKPWFIVAAYALCRKPT